MKQKVQKKTDNMRKTRYFPVGKAFGLDISDASLKAVQIAKKGKNFVIQTHSYMPLPLDVIHRGEVRNPEYLTKAIKELLAKAVPRPIESKYVIVSLPEALAFLHPFEFPRALSEKQILNAIPFEVEGEIPIKLSSVYSSVQFHRARDNKHHVVFAAAPKELVDQYVQVILNAGLEPVAFDLDSPALVRTLVEQSDEPIILLDIGAWSSTITIVERGNVHGYVSVPLGGSHLTQVISEKNNLSFAEAEEKKVNEGIFKAIGVNRVDLENKLGFLVGEIAKATQFHEKHTGRPAKKIIICGGTAGSIDIINYLKTVLNLEVQVGDPLAMGVEFAGYSEEEKKDFLNQKESFSSTVGLAIRGAVPETSGSDINLLPDSFREIYENWETNILLAFLSLVLLVSIFVIVIFSSFWITNYVSLNRQAEFEKKIDFNSKPIGEETLAEINETNKQIAKLQKVDDLRVNVATVISTLFQAVPTGIRLTGITLSTPQNNKETLNVTIKGVANTRADISKLEQKMLQQEGVTDLDMPVSNFDRASNAPFSLTLKMKIFKDDFSK